MGIILGINIVCTKKMVYNVISTALGLTSHANYLYVSSKRTSKCDVTLFDVHTSLA